MKLFFITPAGERQLDTKVCNDLIIKSSYKTSLFIFKILAMYFCHLSSFCIMYFSFKSNKHSFFSLSKKKDSKEFNEKDFLLWISKSPKSLVKIISLLSLELLRSKFLIFWSYSKWNCSTTSWFIIGLKEMLIKLSEFSIFWK